MLLSGILKITVEGFRKERGEAVSGTGTTQKDYGKVGIWKGGDDGLAGK